MVLIVAFTTVWIILIAFVIAQAFYGPPYFLTIAEQGYMLAGPRTYKFPRVLFEGPGVGI